MGNLVKHFSIVSIVSQLIWALLLFSSYSIEDVLTGFGGLGPYLIGALAVASVLGWLLMVVYLHANEEIENKTIWFIALLFLPGQFIFWIQFILESDALEEMNEPTFNRDAFREKYDVSHKPEPVAPPKPAAKRPRGLTPPAFMSLERSQPNDKSRPQV